MKRVVITGMGALTPIGNTVPDFWHGLANGISGAAPITKFDAAKFKTQFACEVKGFEPLNYLEKGEARRYDPFTQYALAAVQEAVQQSQLSPENTNYERVGVIWGSGNGGIQTFEEQVTEFALGDGTPRFNPFFIPKIIVDIAAGVISIKHGFKGINYCTVSACATGNSAIMDAFNYIRWGKANVIITGGSEAAITKAAVGGFGAMKALSTRNDSPATASRPFDVSRDGFVVGEGAGALVLEELEHALRRGAPILAEVAGAAMTADAYHLSATHPEGDGAFRGMREALEDAGLTPADVDYINCHATSTPLGDVSEIAAIRRLYEGSEKLPYISGTKSMAGHLLGAAGAIEAIASVKAIQEGIIPPTINVQQLDPQIPANMPIVTRQAKQTPVRVAMSNTFGFGGHNAIVVFKRYEQF